MKTTMQSVAIALLMTFCHSAELHAVTLGAVQDADVASGSGWEGSNFGDASHISTNYFEADSVIAHIEFDVSSINVGTVQHATLRLFHDFNGTDGTSYDIYRVSSAWDEATVTYPTRPSLDGNVYSTLSIDDSQTEVWREWDVTSLVEEWVDGTSPNFGLAILRNPDQASWPYFRSKDYTDNPEGFPELVVETVPEPTTLVLLGAFLSALSLSRNRNRIA